MKHQGQVVPNWTFIYRLQLFYSYLYLVTLDFIGSLVGT